MRNRAVEIADFETGERMAHLLLAGRNHQQNVGVVKIGLQPIAPVRAEREFDVDGQLENRGIEGAPQFFGDRGSEIPIFGGIADEYMEPLFCHLTPPTYYLKLYRKNRSCNGLLLALCTQT